MAAFPHDCPHCQTKRASFNVLHEYHLPSEDEKIYAFVKCGVCARGAVAVFKGTNNPISAHQFKLSEHLMKYPQGVREIGFFPKPAEPDAPEYLPENVAQYFLEAVANVSTGPNAAGAMFRKSIDVALKRIDSSGKGNLVKRIDSAAKSGLLTSGMAEWAHKIRLDGNDAAHDETPFTVEQAKTLHRFTELVLLYLFTLPGMLSERSGKNEGDE